VIGYRSDEVAAFYAQSSGCPVSARLDTADAIADMLVHKWNLARFPDMMTMAGGVIVSNPLPRHLAMDYDEIETVIQAALAQATTTGRDVTPEVLKAVAEITKGKSVEINRALLVQNAQLAAACAVSKRGTTKSGPSFCRLLLLVTAHLIDQVR